MPQMILLTNHWGGHWKSSPYIPNIKAVPLGWCFIIEFTTVFIWLVVQCAHLENDGVKVNGKDYISLFYEMKSHKNPWFETTNQLCKKNTCSHVSGSNVFQTMKTYVVYWFYQSQSWFVGSNPKPRSTCVLSCFTASFDVKSSIFIGKPW